MSYENDVRVVRLIEENPFISNTQLAELLGVRNIDISHIRTRVGLNVRGERLRKMREKWTQADSFKLVDMVNAGYSDQEIAARLKRPYISVKNKRLEIGMRRDEVIDWSEVDRLIINGAGIVGGAEIAKQAGMRYSRIRYRASVLGVSLAMPKVPFEPYEIDFIAEVADEMDHELIAKKLDRPLVQITRMVSALEMR